LLVWRKPVSERHKKLGARPRNVIYVGGTRIVPGIARVGTPTPEKETQVRW
jgi:hypothetical protein